ncbi:MAG: HEAT repeat domain-containing protein [Fimbriiglobus sp.]|jgi:HEAT repeat protein|nr:HEAT repeat domain-containing protein [Fimbriiglobus sp.]
MRCPFLPLFALFVVLAPANAQDQDPETGGKKLSEWRAMLRESDSPRLRKAAVAALGQIATDNPNNGTLVKDIAQTVGKAMRNDTAAGVRAEAARAISRLADDLLRDTKSDVGSVVVDLSEGVRGEKDSDVRYEQATALQRFGPQAKPAVENLSTALADADPRVKAAAALALGLIGKDAKRSADELLPLVKDGSGDVRRAAVFALGRVEPDDPVKASEAITKFTTDLDEQTRKEAVSSLCLLKDRSPGTVKAVAVALKDASVEVRRMAAAGLGTFERGAKEAEVELLAAIRKDGEDKLVKAYSVRSLCLGLKDDPAKILSELTARLDPTVEKESEVRIAICDEIGDFGPEAQSAVPALRLAQKDPEVKVRDAATFAIKKVIAKKEEKKDK